MNKTMKWIREIMKWIEEIMKSIGEILWERKAITLLLVLAGDGALGGPIVDKICESQPPREKEKELQEKFEGLSKKLQDASKQAGRVNTVVKQLQNQTITINISEEADKFRESR